MNHDTVYSRASKLVTAMTDETLQSVWDSLGGDVGYEELAYNGLSADDWGELLYSELCIRGMC